MYSEKKITKEDTWRTDDLLKHMQGRRNDEGTGNKQDYLGTEDIRKARRGESADRRQRGQERITHWETDGSGERTRHKDKERDRERDGTQERTRHKDKERDRERDGTREKTRHKDKERDRERDGTRERTRHKDKERERERDGTRERTRHRDKEKDREQDGTRERTRHRDKERDREQDGTREKTRHRDKERDREQDGTRDRTRHRDKEKDREQDGTQERPKHRDKERDRDQDRMRDSRREIDERKQEKRKEWEILEKIEYNKESRDSRQERSEKEDRERERMRDERDREHGIKRDRKRAEERGGDRHREKEQERWKEKDGYRDRERGHSSKHVKESNQSKEEVQDPHTEQRARHREREHSRQKEDKEYREQRRREKEEKGRRQREREQWESVESWRDDEDSRDGGKVGRDVEQRDGGRKERVRHRDSRHVEVKHSDEALSQETFGNRKRWTQEDSEKPNEGRRQLKGKPEDAEVNVVSPENLGQEDAEEYEEDFEDYEEDFEEAEQSDEAKEDEAGGGDGGGDGRAMSPRLRKEVEAIQRAMEAENRRLGPIQSMSWTGEQEAAGRDATADGVILHNRASKQGKFINFVAAKRREISKKIADKQKKRSVELLRLIDLDFSVTFSLLDLPPLTEYDMYIKSFGSTNTKQAYVQCNEDNTDRDVQTEDIETNDRWTQHPGDRGFSCGGPGLTSETSDEQGGGLSTGSPRLSAFLLSAAQVITVLLEEDRAKRLSLKRPVLQGGTLSCCDGSLQLSSAVPFLRGREVGLVLFSQAHRQTMLSVHRSSARPSPIDLDSKTILCIWNIWEPSYPQKILVYESEVCCCCFGPGNASLVFAGTAVGSLVLWDLREPSSQHSSIRIGEQDWTLRYPTFSTDAVLVTSAHLCPVTSVELIPPSAAEAQRTSFPVVPWQEESSGLSFQLGSLDEKGVLNLWVVVELRRGDDAGSHVDLGLKPGGKVKLLHSSSVSLLQQSFPAEALTLGSVQTLLLKFHPSDSSHFFVGTNMSLVYHGTRHSLRSTPTFYRAHKAGLSPAQVTSLEFSPFSEPVFLVGCDDGSVRLHSVPSESPVAQWCCGAGGSVVSAHWSLTRPAVFCTLDVAASVIHVWDLLQKDSEPVVTEKVHPDHAATMAVFGDPSKQSSFSGISLATQSGKLEIHYFSRSWAVPGRGEREWLQTLASDVY